MKDHSGESLFSLLLDSLIYTHADAQTHTKKDTLRTALMFMWTQNRKKPSKISRWKRGEGKIPVRVVRAAAAVPLLLPPPVPVNQLAEVGRLLTVFDDELVLEELFGCWTLRGEKKSLPQFEVLSVVRVLG